MNIADPVQKGKYNGKCVDTPPEPEPPIIIVIPPNDTTPITPTPGCTSSADCTDAALPICKEGTCSPMSCANSGFTFDGLWEDYWASVTPMKGKYTMMYFKYISSSGCLCLFNDWISSSGQICPDNYNYFKFTLKGCTGWFNCAKETWEFYLYGDQTMKIIRDGTVILAKGTPDNMGKAGFGTSPNLATKHTTYEMCLPSQKGMTMTMNIADPVQKGKYNGKCVDTPPEPEPPIIIVIPTCDPPGPNCDPNVTIEGETTTTTPQSVVETTTTTPAPTTTTTVKCTGTKYTCHAWGDPHYTESFFGGAFDFMKLGLFLLAKTSDNSLEVQTFQYPTGTGEAIFGGFAVKIYATLITIIGKEITIDGAVVTTYNLNGIVVSDTSKKFHYESPDDCVIFNTQWAKYYTVPYYYLNMYVQIAEEKKTTMGICGAAGDHAPLSPSDSLFSQSQLQGLCTKAGMSDCTTFVPPAKWSIVKTAEGACNKAGIPYQTGVEKCSRLQANLTYFSGCILDYCVTGDDSMVTNAVTQMNIASSFPKKETCDSLKVMCPADRPVNKQGYQECKGFTDSCDVDTCCLATATCDMYTCPNHTPLNRGSGTACPKGQLSCNARICCDKRAACKKSVCTAAIPEFKAGTLCSGKADTCDADTCCKVTCDWQCYLDRYPPLKRALKNNLAAAERHYTNNGRRENRICTCPPAECDFQCYMDNYPKLKTALKNDKLRAQLHYESHGAEENRDCTCHAR